MGSLSGCPVLRSVALVPEAQPSDGTDPCSQLSPSRIVWAGPSVMSSNRTWLFK